MRDNFSVMKSLSEYTRVGAEARMGKLLAFNRRLNAQPNIVQELEQWNLKLDKDLLDIKARVLPPERILFGGNASVTPNRGDWTREMQNKRCLVPKELREWVFIVSERDRRTAQVLLQTLFLPFSLFFFFFLILYSYSLITFCCIVYRITYDCDYKFWLKQIRLYSFL